MIKMKIVRLKRRQKGSKAKKIETYGFIDEKKGKIATKEDIIFATGVPIPRNIEEFLFDGWYQRVTGSEIPYKKSIKKYKILAPLPNPGKIICLAYNYLDHAIEQKEEERTQDPVLVIKPRTTLTGTNSKIRCPDFVKQLDYEIELAVIIGNKCKNVTVESAYKHIFGYMILNDVSARDIQFKDKQFTRAKGFDSFAPCGPWITTADEISDPQNLKLITKINGETRQNSSTSQMLLKIPQIISKLSKVMTLESGDIISTGTSAGVALNNPGVPYLKDGDKIEMEIEGLGTIYNTVKIIHEDDI